MSGEPGIGKTEVIRELLRRPVMEPFAVLFGRGDRDTPVPYGPWVDVLSQLLNAEGADIFRPLLNRSGAVLRRLGLAIDQPDSDGGQDPAETADQYQLFHTIVGLFSLASADTALAIVLDDLQWADKPTLLLLKYILRSSTPLRLLLLATFRDTEIDLSNHVKGDLAEIWADPCVQRIELGGLDLDDLRALSRSAGLEGADLSAALLDQTGGNAFFALELIRHRLDNDGRGAEEQELLPSTVRDVVTDRVGRLGETTTQILRAAAIVGREFDARFLASVVEKQRDEVVDVLRRATTATLLRPATYDAFVFTHDLVSQVLVEELPPSLAARLHRRVASILASETTTDDRRDAEIYRHLVAAGDSDDLSGALAAAREAGRAAISRLGPDEAVRWFSAGLELAGRIGLDRAATCELAIDLGDAQRQAGVRAYRTTLLDAAATAVDLGRDDLLVRAALANNRGYQSVSRKVDHDRVAVLEQALARIPSEEPGDYAAVAATLANELCYSAQDGERRVWLSDRALEASLAADARIQTDVLIQRLLAIMSPSTLDERLRNSGDATRLAQATADPALQSRAAIVRAATLFDAFELTQAERWRLEALRLADEVGQPLLRWTARWHSVEMLVLAGRLTDADEAARSGFEIGMEAGERDAADIYGFNLYGIRQAQGRLEELESLMIAGLDSEPDEVGLLITVALLHTEMGRIDEAIALFEPLSRELDRIPRDPGWLALTAACAEVSYQLPGAPGASDLYGRLKPWEGQVAAVSAISFGAVGRQLGDLAAALGDLDAARAHLRRCAEQAAAQGALLELARTRLAMARVEIQRGDRPGAYQLARAAQTEALGMGAASVAQRAQVLLDTAS
jgi:tetratricopeptide (TPR) repeat protein